ncbi:alpha/beta hydrolase [Ferdinandcohnia quinoae]|uniref:Alpha/beta fold hydrolase n=1 Tax=Fredinandcohnia quinoae TaxID=2918902 RepID=A0AAW5E1W2_9BACI|nr:alpha/beta fold hydrolase [Fredinandcohnia sp. SECRCQ15]MCH1626603.1 alpha/beta fold hydrolase [Fredinandcohnia sp. SECRCQ15]
MIEKYPVLKEAEAFYFEGNDIGILVSHGFTGSTQSMRFLGEQLAKEGFTVCGPRLKGHGTHFEDMELSMYQEWIESLEEGFKRLRETCSKIFITGLSMGGTLTLYLASKYPEIKGIIPINAAIEIEEMAKLAGALEPRFLDAIGSDIKKEGVIELAYEKTPLKSIGEIVQLMRITKERLPLISCPALIFVSTEDHVVPPENSMYIMETITSSDKEIVKLTNSYHVATIDNDKELIAEKSVKFIKEHL